ncbi:MAG: D-alanine--D-alanine ligase [Bacteroidales bacterium]|nr:D-alanine--D-alanine ligase [Bacteroidales bacterium]MDD4711896.1 D-alanine--D-alanine ligase [Bacteroidales bacterium]
MKSRRIAIVCGGDSSEMPVSLKSAQGLYSFIDKTIYQAWIVVIQSGNWYVRLNEEDTTPVDKNDFSFDNNGEKITFDFAWITIHGTPGEDGRLQGYFDLIGMPYSCCGVLSAAITFSKFTCNQYLKGFGVKVAESVLLRNGQSISDTEVVDAVGLPCFIKCNVGGSSFGVTKVKKAEEIQAAIDRAFAEGSEVIIESFMSGTEVTCGCYKTKKGTHLFPVTEVVSQNEFFDYDAKYKGQVQEITPARIPDETRDRIQAITSLIYDILGCKGIIRADFIITSDGIKLLEVNTTPGMTATSFIPQQVAVAGMKMCDVMDEIIEDCFQ